MKKLRIYLDTSVISHLDQQDAPERMAETHRLWSKVKSGEFDIVISDVVLGEINRCEECKRNTLYGYLAEITYATVAVDERALEIASRIIDLGVLRQKNLNDCRHIAAAIISGCDIIASWNFRHMVNHNTIMGVKAITALEGYKDMLIYAPSSLIGGE
ncbi:MAG: PIN domain-containing protein [Synergistaceae bacterium]|jgi:predicted nucleic acid-binding protein|nr:PIN domain-containing protein [Synergistaceae bacterium]